MNLPLGFEAAGICAGLKPSGKPDLGVIYSGFPLYWALSSTENALKAPCVSRNRVRYSTEQFVHGVVVNSGNANCATGEQGIWDNEDFAGLSAGALGLARPQDMLTASTGVVGQRLDMTRLKSALPKLRPALAQKSKAFAEAIVTTDHHLKQASVKLKGGGRIVGVAKGSGMIHPNMATMLAFVMTDAAIPQDILRRHWQTIVSKSFNCVTVDGDTSPNDMAFLFASRQVKAELDDVLTGLLRVCQSLAKKIARDGEGATKLLTVRVKGARSEKEAALAARAVAKSSLVKAAVHGADPNWGRILVAAGYSGAVMNPADVVIALQTLVIYRGTPQPFDEQLISESMAVNDVLIDLDLAAGEAEATAWGCDLSREYVAINADYTT